MSNNTYPPPPSIVSLGGGDLILKHTVIDFGSLPVAQASFILPEPSVSASSFVIGRLGADGSKDEDEIPMDAVWSLFVAQAGQIKLYVKGLEGYLHDKFLASYIIA